MEKSFEIGQIVIIRAKHPFGVLQTSTKGQIGVVVEVEKFSSETCYRVHNFESSFLYTTEELRLANNSEIREQFSNMFIFDYVRKNSKTELTES